MKIRWLRTALRNLDEQAGYIANDEPASYNSAAHGAGRAMSRRQSKETFRWSTVRRELAQRRVKLVSAGLDEVPGAYKDIETIMKAQSNLIQIRARFDPRIVKMADDGYVED